MTISGSPPEYNGYCSFEVGQHVVCVDNTPDPGRRWVNNDPPVVGRVYTVDSIGLNKFEVLCITLREQPRRPDAVKSGVWGYRASRFRPAPSIDALTALLREAPTPVSAEQEHAG